MHFVLYLALILIVPYLSAGIKESLSLINRGGLRRVKLKPRETPTAKINLDA
jgi:hypothetical protein